MTYTRAELNRAVSHKLKDIDTATGMHKALFLLTQLSGLTGIAGGLLILPLAVEVGAVTASAGCLLWGISQIIQSHRLCRFLPLPGVPISAEQIVYWPSAIASHLLGAEVAEAPENTKLLPVEWLPGRERRIAYLLTHCADVLIATAESAQPGISFAAIVDTAVRASEYAISDEQLSNPVTANQLASEVRQLLNGDTSALAARQQAAITQTYRQAQQDLADGHIEADEFAEIEAEVREIAPDITTGNTAITPSAQQQPAEPFINTAAKALAPGETIRTDWQSVFALIQDQSTYPAIAIIGAQGLGKTTLVEYILSTLRREKIVLDPHYKKGTWPGCRVIGAGMDYDAVDAALANLSADVKERYMQRACNANYRPQPVTLVLEEQTNWGTKVESAAKFIKETLSDIRKVGYQSISVAHSDTNTARGGAVGTRKMRDNGELKIELLDRGLAKVTIKGGEPFRLRYPDPQPYTTAMGEPLITTGGNLGPGFIGTDYVVPTFATSALAAHQDDCIKEFDQTPELAALVKDGHSPSTVFEEAFSWLSNRERDGAITYDTLKSSGWARKLTSRGKETIIEFLSPLVVAELISFDDSDTLIVR